MVPGDRKKLPSGWDSGLPHWFRFPLGPPQPQAQRLSSGEGGSLLTPSRGEVNSQRVLMTSEALECHLGGLTTVPPNVVPPPDPRPRGGVQPEQARGSRPLKDPAEWSAS